MMTKRTALVDKIMIVGIDGMDPKLTMKYMAEGKMPNTKRILERGVASKDLFKMCIRDRDNAEATGKDTPSNQTILQLTP